MRPNIRVINPIYNWTRGAPCSLHLPILPNAFWKCQFSPFSPPDLENKTTNVPSTPHSQMEHMLIEIGFKLPTSIGVVKVYRLCLTTIHPPFTPPVTDVAFTIICDFILPSIQLACLKQVKSNKGQQGGTKKQL